MLAQSVSSHRYQRATVRELPRRPVDVVAEFLHTDDWRERAFAIAAQDATRRAIVGKPSK